MSGLDDSGSAASSTNGTRSSILPINSEEEEDRKRRWEDNIREWTGLDLADSQWGSGGQRRVEKAGGIILKCAPAKSAEVKG